MVKTKCSGIGFALGAVLLGALTAGVCQAQQPVNDVAGAQVLTRGPVHEAFAGIVSFNPEPGVGVTKVPPALIEEMPPDEKPEGDNVTWIPGYWAWDDERTDFLWVSGTWRALPPGRQWMAGYWGETTQGYQWTSGYWADAKVRETTYLPPPPATVEVGPNIAAPSLDYGWTPGCWEVKTVEPAPGKPGKTAEPSKVQLPRSPIVAKPISQVPPKAPQAPQPNLKVQPNAEPVGRPPNEERSNPQTQSRPPEPQKNPLPARSETAPVAAPVRPPVQPPRAKEPEVKSPQEPRPGTGGVEESAPRGPQPTAYLRPVPVERGASKLLRKAQQSEGKGQTRDTPPPANGKEQARP